VDLSVHLIGIEAAGEGVASGRCAATITEERCSDLRVVVEEF
jgi:tryptophan synthase beta subunit